MMAILYISRDEAEREDEAERDDEDEGRVKEVVTGVIVVEGG